MELDIDVILADLKEGKCLARSKTSISSTTH